MLGRIDAFSILLLLSMYNGVYNCSAMNWPDGTYGLPKPSTGCPTGDGWVEGSRIQTVDPDTFLSRNSIVLAQRVGENLISQGFCMKTKSNEESQGDWPAGSYCIYKYGDCPNGFVSGWIQWGDLPCGNQNSVVGTVPDGSYNEDTKIDFCCRNDTSSEDSMIELPTADPFYLIQDINPERFCHNVTGMTIPDSDEFVWLDTEHTNDDQSSTLHPSIGKLVDGSGVVIYYCYYAPE